jgi:hypothetical protein
MEKTLDRTGTLALGVFAVAGLALLSVQLMPVASGYVILLLIPALLVCIYQLVFRREYGLRLDAHRWRVTSPRGAQDIPADTIAYLRITGHGPIARAVIVQSDGTEVVIPFDLAPDPLDLIRAATDLGVSVRTR